MDWKRRDTELMIDELSKSDRKVASVPFSTSETKTFREIFRATKKLSVIDAKHKSK